MSKHSLARLRVNFTLLVTIATAALLTWWHFNGGVPTHHLLHRADMPGISNWWAILVLPILSWCLVGRTLKRIRLDADVYTATTQLPMGVLLGFFGALVFGIVLSTSFTYDFKSLTPLLFQGLLLFALILPFYRAEWVLGFVLGMAFTFGAVIPTIVAVIVAAESAFMHLFVVPAIKRCWVWYKAR